MAAAAKAANKGSSAALTLEPALSVGERQIFLKISWPSTFEANSYSG
jgi:hypothetical protein